MASSSSPETDLKTFFRVFWSYKYLLVLSLLTSLIFALYTIKNSPRKYKAQATVEFLSKDTPSSLKNIQEDLQLMNFISGMSTKSTAVDAIPKILGQDFLSSLIEEYKIKEKLKFSAEFTPPSRLSLIGIMDRFGILKYSEPTLEQKGESFLNTIRSMIRVEPLKYNGTTTSAHTIIVEYRDPIFAAFLANSIVEHYITKAKMEYNTNSKKVLEFLDKTLVEAEEEVEFARKDLENFLIENSAFMEPIVFSGREYNYSFSPKKKITLVGQIEDRVKSIERSIDKLTIALNSKNLANLSLNSTEDIKNFSNVFLEKLGSTERYDNAKAFEMLIQSETKMEIKRLKAVLGRLTNMRSIQKEEASESLSLNEKLTSLQFLLNSKRDLVKYLNQAIVEKKIEFRSEEEENTIDVLSLAIPSNIPLEPNVRLLVLAYVSIAFVLYFLGVVLLQLMRKDVFSVEQLRNYFPLGSVAEISFGISRVGKLFGKSNFLNSKNLSLSFYSLLQEQGKAGCIIDISNRYLMDSSISDDLTLFVGKLLAREDISLLCINNRFDKPLDLRNENGENLYIRYNPELETEKRKGKVSVKSEFNNFFNAENLPSKRLIDQNFDKVLVSVDNRQNDLIKLNLIENCDFFLLIGRVGRFNVSKIENYVQGTQSKKCVGFFLIS